MEPTELPCLGILKHGNYDLTIRWMYVLFIDTPTSVRAQPERHALAVARINRLVLAKWGTERTCAVPPTTIPRCFRVWNPLKQRGTLKKKKEYSLFSMCKQIVHQLSDCSNLFRAVCSLYGSLVKSGWTMSSGKLWRDLLFLYLFTRTVEFLISYSI